MLCPVCMYTTIVSHFGFKILLYLDLNEFKGWNMSLLYNYALINTSCSFHSSKSRYIEHHSEYYVLKINAMCYVLNLYVLAKINYM